MASGLEVIHSLLLVVYDIRVFPMRYPRHRPRLSNFIGNVLPGWDAVKTFSLTASFPFALQLTCFSLTIESQNTDFSRGGDAFVRLPPFPLFHYFHTCSNLSGYVFLVIASLGSFFLFRDTPTNNYSPGEHTHTYRFVLVHCFIQLLFFSRTVGFRSVMNV